MTFIGALPGIARQVRDLGFAEPDRSGLEVDELLGLAGIGEGELALREDHADVRPRVRVGVAGTGREHDLADAHLVRSRAAP